MEETSKIMIGNFPMSKKTWLIQVLPYLLFGFIIVLFSCFLGICGLFFLPIFLLPLFNLFLNRIVMLQSSWSVDEFGLTYSDGSTLSCLKKMMVFKEIIKKGYYTTYSQAYAYHDIAFLQLSNIQSKHPIYLSICLRNGESFEWCLKEEKIQPKLHEALKMIAEHGVYIVYQ